MNPLLGSGPALALSALARHLRLPFDPEDLEARVADHGTPHSLLALVEVARTLGLTARGFQADWDDLAGATFPAVVHLRGDDGGFALLLEHDPTGVVLEVPPARARIRLDRERFTAAWSGVLVLFERDPTVPPVLESSPGMLRTGAPLAGLRKAALLGTGILALAGAARLALDTGSVAVGISWALVSALAFTAATVSAVLVLASRRSRVPSATPRLVAKICGRGSLLDCEGVLGSKYSRIAGVELAVLGLALLGGSLVLLSLAALLPPQPRLALVSWISWAWLGMVPGAVFLVGVQVWPLRRFCPLCLAVHACVILGAALASPFLRQASVGAVAPWALLHAVAALATAGLVVPFLEGALEIRTHRTRLAWIAATPWGALAEVAGRPAGPSWQLADHAVLGRSDATFRADALVHPTCGGCPPLLESLQALLVRRPEAVRVMLQFPTRDPAGAADRALCVALASIARLRGGRAALDAFLRAKTTVRTLLEAADAGGPAAVLRTLAPEIEATPAVLEQAHAEVAEADRVLAQLRRGTPTLLIEGRPWDAPLEDFESLLAAHPAQLSAVLRPAEHAVEEERT